MHPRQWGGTHTIDAEHRKVGIRIVADEIGTAGRTVEENDRDPPGALDDVAVGDDEAVGREQEARSGAARPGLDLDDSWTGLVDGMNDGAGIAVEDLAIVGEVGGTHAPIVRPRASERTTRSGSLVLLRKAPAGEVNETQLIYFTRLAAGPATSRSLVYHRNDRAGGADVQSHAFAPRRVAHACSAAAVSRPALVADLGVQGAVSDRERLEHVGVLRLRHCFADPARAARDDARRRGRRLEPVHSELAVAQPRLSDALQHGVPGHHGAGGRPGLSTARRQAE